ncbi:hypothetical protein, partial [Actinomadura roseirufa]|uniref:hypothetical protein n=1 Tax=Actinomadura roseirufa TaxID=2094049 RepID=UPI0010418FEB
MSTPMPLQPCFRLARAVVFATVCLTMTTAGHAYAARLCVPPGAVVLGFALVTGLSLLLAGAERSFGTILGVLTGAQFGLHALFTAASAGTVHHGIPPHVTAGGSGGLGGMTLVHLGTAVAAAWWMRRGEAALWSLARRISAAAAGAWRPLVTGARPAVPAVLLPRPPGP